MLTGGKLADLSAEGSLITGLTVFGGSSLACALAPTADSSSVHASSKASAQRSWPATLSIIAATFPPRQRGAAIGSGSGSRQRPCNGPLVGGLLTEHAGWSSIFYVNVPIGAVAVAATFLFVAESKDTSREQRPDLLGLVTSGLGLFALTYGLIEGNSHGWTSGLIVATFAVAAISLQRSSCSSCASGCRCSTSRSSGAAPSRARHGHPA